MPIDAGHKIIVSNRAEPDAKGTEVSIVINLNDENSFSSKVFNPNPNSFCINRHHHEFTSSRCAFSISLLAYSQLGSIDRSDNFSFYFDFLPCTLLLYWFAITLLLLQIYCLKSKSHRLYLLKLWLPLMPFAPKNNMLCHTNEIAKPLHEVHLLPFLSVVYWPWQNSIGHLLEKSKYTKHLCH